jgi:hypothetical protein
MRSVWIAAGAGVILLVAGCGAGTPGPNTTVVTESNRIVATAAAQSATTADKYDSAGYCQQLQTGDWVTNDSADSTTACVPDPAYATGDRVADASQAIRRCFTCKLADWNRAEQRKARQAPALSDGATSADTTDPDGWSPQDRNQVFAACTSSLGVSTTLCECVVNSVVPQIPASEASSLSPHDARLQAAAIECDPDAGEGP